MPNIDSKEVCPTDIDYTEPLRAGLEHYYNEHKDRPAGAKGSIDELATYLNSIVKAQQK